MKVVTVTSNESACVVTWQDGGPDIEDGPLAEDIADFLTTERDFPVGDASPVEGSTAGFGTERRLPENEFEMALTLMQLPYETTLPVVVYIHDQP